LNKVIPEDEVLDQQSLPKVKMPIGDDYAKLHEWKPRTSRLEGYPAHSDEVGRGFRAKSAACTD